MKILHTGKLRDKGEALWWKLPHWVGNSSWISPASIWAVSTQLHLSPPALLRHHLHMGSYLAKPGLWFKRPLSTGKLLFQSSTFKLKAGINKESHLTKLSRKIKGAEAGGPALHPPVESSSLVYCIWTAQTKTQCSAVKYFLFGSSQSCSKGTCEIHSWVILEWSGPDGSSQMWPNSS